MMRNMLAKYSRRGARVFSTVPSSYSSTLKRVWDDQSFFPLFLAFGGGFVGWAYMNLQKRKMLLEKIYRMKAEHFKYREEMLNRVARFDRGEYDEGPTLKNETRRKTNSGHHP